MEVLRKLLIDSLGGGQAHVTFKDAVKDFPAALRGKKPPAASHTAWQLLEHLRMAQHDILEFSRDPKYVSPKWPEGYWPKTEAPPNSTAWNASIKKFRQDLRAMQAL